MTEKSNWSVFGHPIICDAPVLSIEVEQPTCNTIETTTSDQGADSSSMIPEKLQNVTWAVDTEKLLPNIELLQGIDYSTEDNTITKIGWDTNFCYFVLRRWYPPKVAKRCQETTVVSSRLTDCYSTRERRSLREHRKWTLINWYYRKFLFHRFWIAIINLQ